MDGNQFDRVTKWMSSRRTRRDTMRALVGGALSGAAIVAGAGDALAGKPEKPGKPPKPESPDCCPSTSPKLCGLTCTDVLNDASNCGVCGKACPPGGVCTNGTCSCPSGQTLCNGACVSTTTSTSNCGICGNNCPAPANGTATCANSVCGISCNAGYTDCNGVCRHLSDDVANCGGCNQVCTSPASGTATCANGQCGFTCNSDYTKCSGACVNTSTDTQHCGDCATTCVEDQPCVGGACQPTCHDGIKNGNESDIDCGGGTCPTCDDGKVCTTGGDCTSGNCVDLTCSTCPQGQTPCNGACVTLATDTANCGQCGQTCLPNQPCTGGMCQPTCTDGVKNGNESDIDCGGSCPACANGRACGVNADCQSNNCSGGVCKPLCPSGQTLCNGVCVAYLTDNNNCGSCGHVCAVSNAASYCQNGQCLIASCNVGYGDCDGNPANGCETNFNTDTNNCGRCGNRCPAGFACRNGACVQTCASAATCPATECAPAVCTNGYCGTTYAAYGTPIAAQTAGDCQKVVCDGSGGVTSIADDTDLPVDNALCTNPVCTNGVLSHPPKPAGTVCQKGLCDSENNLTPPVMCDGAGNCSVLGQGGNCGSKTCTPTGCIA